MRTSKCVSADEDCYNRSSPKRTVSKTTYPSDVTSTNSSPSTCVMMDKKLMPKTLQRNPFTWSQEIPALRSALKTVVKGAFEETRIEEIREEREAKKPRIIDLCDEDKKRVVNLVAELEKHVEENRSLSEELSQMKKEATKKEETLERIAAELNELKKEAIQSEGDIERMNLAHTNKLHALQTELDILKQNNEILSKDFDLISQQNDCLEEKLRAKSARNKDLEREKRTLQSQLLLTKKKLSHAVKVAERCKADLRDAVKLLKKHQGRDRVSEGTQTENEKHVESNESTEDTIRCAPARSNGTERLLLSELFFTARSVPMEMEHIFFLPAPFNQLPENLAFLERYPDRKW